MVIYRTHAVCFHYETYGEMSPSRLLNDAVCIYGRLYFFSLFFPIICITFIPHLRWQVQPMSSQSDVIGKNRTN